MTIEEQVASGRTYSTHMKETLEGYTGVQIEITDPEILQTIKDCSKRKSLRFVFGTSQKPPFHWKCCSFFYIAEGDPRYPQQKTDFLWPMSAGTAATPEDAFWECFQNYALISMQNLE